MSVEDESLVEETNNDDASSSSSTAQHHHVGSTTAGQQQPPTLEQDSLPSKRRRHGAQNHDRHKRFTKWLLHTFPHLFISPPPLNPPEASSSSSRGVSSNDAEASFPKSHVIMDVAGGKGELAARLSMCHRLQVVLVDPRPAQVAECFLKRVLPKLPKKWQQRLYEKQSATPTFCQDTMNERVTQLVMAFDDDSVQNSLELREAIRTASLLTGMHADGATEAIVDAALLYKKPFVVVPCCVFPRLFSKRVLLGPDGNSSVPVRSHEQFCEYLLRKDSRFVMETLPFPGRNIAIWWDGR